MSIFNLSLSERRIALDVPLLMSCITAVSIVMQNSMELSYPTRFVLGGCLLVNICLKGKKLLYMLEGDLPRMSGITLYNEGLSRSAIASSALYSAFSFSCLINFLLHSITPNFNTYAEIILQWPLYGFLYYSLVHCEQMCYKEDINKRLENFAESKLQKALFLSCTAIPAVHCIAYSLISPLIGAEFSHLIIISVGTFVIQNCLIHDINEKKEMEQAKSV